MLKHLLSSVKVFSPPNEGGAADPVDGDEYTDDDDESVSDPVGETDEEDPDSDDTGGSNDHQGDDAGGGDPPPRQSRGDRQYGELRKQARERADENARLTRQLADANAALAQARAPVQQQETAQQRAERHALMSPEERAEERITESLRAHDQRQQVLTNQLMDQSDRSAFSARCTVNPLFKKLEAEVERELTTLRARGENLSREAIATYLIGQRVVAQQGKAKPGVQQRRRQQQAAPVRSGGDGGGTGARRQRTEPNSAQDYEDRYGDVAI